MAVRNQPESTDEHESPGFIKRHRGKITIGLLALVVGVCGVLVALWGILQADIFNTGQSQDNATVIAIQEEQLAVQREIATLQAEAFKIREGPTATAIAQEIEALISTQTALEAELTAQPVAEPQDAAPQGDAPENPAALAGLKRVGEFYESEGIRLGLVGYGISTDGVIYLTFDVSNTSERKILLRYQSDYFTVEDDTGKDYGQDEDFLHDLKQRELSPDDSYEIVSKDYANDANEIGVFYGMVPEDASYLVVTVSKFASLENLQWQIPLNSEFVKAQEPVPGTPQTLLEGYSADGIEMLLSDYSITSDGVIVLSFLVRNNGNNYVLLRYQDKYFEVTDDLGTRYDQDEDSLLDQKQVLLGPGESFEMHGKDYPNDYHEIGVFYGMIPEQANRLIVNVSHLGPLQDMQWEIPLN